MTKKQAQIISDETYILCFQVVGGRCLVFAPWPSVFFTHAYGVFVFVLNFMIPILILSYCYGRILWVLTRRIDTNVGDSTNKTTPGNKLEDLIREKFQLARTNTIKTFLLVGICFIICWMGNQIYFFMHNLGYYVDFNSPFYKFTVLMVFVNSTVNPFIYLIKYKDYQQALRELFKCKKQKEKEESDTKPSDVFTLEMSL